MRFCACWTFVLAVLLALTLPRTMDAADDLVTTEMAAEIAVSVNLMDLVVVGETVTLPWSAFDTILDYLRDEHNDSTVYAGPIVELLRFHRVDVPRDRLHRADVAFHWLN